MPRDGSGNYTLPVNSVDPAVAATTISSTDFNQLTADLATELTDSVNRSGKGAMLSNLAMGGFKLTNLGAPASANDSARLTDLTLGGNVTGTLASNVVSFITGSVTGSFPTAGRVGEVLSNSASGAGVAGNTPSSIVALNVTAGNWLLMGHTQFTSAGGCIVTYFGGCISTVNNAFTPVQTNAVIDQIPLQSANINWHPGHMIAMVSQSSTVTMYIVTQSNFTSGTCTNSATLQAIRIS